MPAKADQRCASPFPSRFHLTEIRSSAGARNGWRRLADVSHFRRKHF